MADFSEGSEDSRPDIQNRRNDVCNPTDPSLNRSIARMGDVARSIHRSANATEDRRVNQSRDIAVGSETTINKFARDIDPSRNGRRNQRRWSEHTSHIRVLFLTSP